MFSIGLNGKLLVRAVAVKDRGKTLKTVYKYLNPENVGLA